MLIIIWEYSVPEQSQAEFERIYAPGGMWSELFGKSSGYLGTELFKDEQVPGRYLSLDRWESQAAYERFQSEHAAEYEALDRLCSQLTQAESLVGHCVSLP